MRGQELKYHDISDVEATVSASGLIVDSGSLVLIPQGTTPIQRIGRKAVIKSINLRGHVSLPGSSSASNTTDSLRIILYKDKQCNGATATATDILATADYQSFRNLNNSARFTVLLDKVVTLNTQLSGNGTAHQSGVAGRDYTFFKKCNIPLEYDSTLGALSEIRSNNIGMLLISRNALMSHEFHCRFRFTDS